MKQKYILIVIGLLGGFTFTISAIALLGVITGNEGLRSWGRPIPMPLNVTLCLLAVGTALFLIGKILSKEKDK